MQKSIIFYLLLFCFSCQTNPAEIGNDGQNSTNSIQLVTELADSADENMPKSEVFFEINKSKIKIANILNGEPIVKENYEQYQIPLAAISAVGGWWAGSGDYFYLLLKNEKFIVYHGVTEEESLNNDYDYLAIATFDSAGKPIYSLAELVGFYTAGGHDESFVLFAGMNNDSLRVEFFETDGMLPPEEELTRHLANFKRTKFQKFDVNLKNLTFDSDFGLGTFEKDGRHTSIIFYDKKNQLEEELQLFRIDN